MATLTPTPTLERPPTERPPILRYRRRRARALEPAWLMPAIDVSIAFLAFVLAYIVRYQVQNQLNIRPGGELFFYTPFDSYLPYMLFFILWLYLNYRGGGLYRTIRTRGWLEEVGIIVNGATNATVLLMAISFAVQPAGFSRLMIIYVGVFAIVLLSLSRVIRRLIFARLRARGIGVQRALVVGAGEVGRAVLQTLIARKALGYVPVGYLDDNPDRGSTDLGRLRGLGELANLPDVLREHQVDVVIVTLPWRHQDKIYRLIETCQRAHVDVSIVPDLFQLNLRQVQVENVDGIPLMSVNARAPMRVGGRVAKRVGDVLAVVIAAPVWLLVFAAVAVAIRLEGPGPIFYIAPRVGQEGRPFGMIKFRSMIPDADKYRNYLVQAHALDPRHPKIKDDPRITRVGRFIRRTSLDELPNLINVFKGDMSLVGPRPPTADEVAHYEPWHRRRLEVKPGMTGLWQISGRSEVPFDEMCLLDIYYIDNWTIPLDLQILLLTVPRVLLRHGAY